MSENIRTRLGNGFSKFGREGSVWRWQFYWNKGKAGLQDGYDKGYLNQNADIFERLKTRFFTAVLLNNNYYKKAHYFILYLCSQIRKYDVPVLELNIKPDYTLSHSFTQQAKSIFSEGSLNYISELVQNTYVQIKSKEHAKNIDINKMIEEANQKYSKPKDNDARIQTFWQQLLIDCFPKEVRPSLATIRAKADKEKKEFILFCSELQKDFLEENISLWANYFLKKTHNYSITYVLPKPTQEPMPVSINNSISDLVNKFKL